LEAGFRIESGIGSGRKKAKIGKAKTVED